jgi:hypothetical protein
MEDVEDTSFTILEDLQLGGEKKLKVVSANIPNWAKM